MAALTGTKIQDTYDGLLKVSDNVGINSTKKIITDGLGNNSSVKISSEDFEVGGFFFVDIDGNIPDSKIGIGTSSPTETLHVVGDFRLTARFYDGSNSPGLSGRVLMSTGSATSWSNTFTASMTFDGGVQFNAGIKDYTGSKGTAGQVLSSTGSNNFDIEWVSLSEIQGVDGTGTANYIPVWTDSDTIGNSVIYQSNSNIGIGTLSPGSYKLNVFGDFKLDSNGSGYMQSDYGDHRISIYDSNDNQVVAFQDLDGSSANQLVVSSSGVGIGTATPNRKFHVVSSEYVIADFVRSSGNNSYLSMEDSGTTGSGYVGVGANANNLVLRSGNAERARLTSAGNFGIGTTSPGARLHVHSGSLNTTALFQSSDDKAFIIIRDDDTDSYLISRNSAFYIGANSSDITTFKVDLSSGNVAIGTNSPQNKLEVVGDIRITNANGSNPTDAGSLIFNESGTTWATDIYGFRINMQGSSNYLNFQSANTTTVKDILTLTRDTARVGIGTTSPSEKLSVSGGNIAVANGSSIMIGGSIGDTKIGKLYNVTGVLSLDGDGTRNIRLGSTTNGEVVRIDNTNGRVGIGTTSPSEKLEVVGDNAIIRVTDSNTTIRYAAFQISTNGGQWFISSGDNNTGAGVANSDLWITRAKNGTNNRFRFHRDHSRFSVYSSGSQNIQLDANGNTFFNGGNVGIGTTSPTEKLDVNGNITIRDIGANRGIRRNNTGYDLRLSGGTSPSTGAHISLSGDSRGGAGSSYQGRIDIVSGGDNFASQANVTGNINFTTQWNGGTSSIMVLDSSTGRVGVGTGSPSATLHVKPASGGNGEINIERTSGTLINLQAQSALGVIGTNSNHNLAFKTNSNVGMVLTTGRRVGIGTTSPGAPLDVKSNSTSSADSGIRLIANGSSDVIAAIGEKSTNGGRFHLYDGGVVKVSLYGDGTSNYIAAGNVGIGNTNPASAKLVIREDSNYGLRLEDASGHYFRVNTGGDTEIRGNVTVNDQIHLNAAGSLIRKTVTSWTNAQTHDLIYQGWNTNIDDYIYLKSPGNTTTNHGIALIGDNVIAFGRTDVEIGAPELTSSSAPISENWFVLNSTTATFSNDIKATGHVYADTHFRSTDGNATLSATGGGGVYLRPNGYSSTTGQVVITASSGDATFSGKVGIGTTSPGGTLHVVGASGGAGQIYLSDVDNGSGTGDSLLISKSGTSAFIYNRDSGNISFGTNNTSNYLNITNTGNVGIGTTSPSSPLTFGKSVYGDFDTEAFYRIKFQDQGGVTNDVGIGQTATGNMGFNITSGKTFLFNGGTSGNALTLTSGGNATFAGEVTAAGGTMTGNLLLNDSVKLSLGNSDDFNMFHNGTDTAIQNITGDLYITNKANDKDIIFRSDDGSGGFTEYFRLDGGTTSIIASKNVELLDNVELKIGTGNDLNIRHNGTESFIQNQTGNLTIQNLTDDGDIIFKSDNGTGGVVEYFRLDGSQADGTYRYTRFLDYSVAAFGNGNNLQMYHTDTNGFISEYEGDLIITNHANDKDIIFRSDDGSGGVTTYFKLDGSDGNVRVSKQFAFLDNVKATFGNAADLQIYHNGTDSYIDDTGSGDLRIRSNFLKIEKYTGETMATFNDDNAVSLYFNNVKKFDTTSSGVLVSGFLESKKSDTGAGYNDGVARFVNETTATSGGSAVINVRNTYGAGFGGLLKFWSTSTSSSIGNISFNSSRTAVNYNTGSDYRLKEDYRDFNGLNIISDIDVYDFKWKNQDDRSYGVIAHELDSVVPGAVTGQKDAEDMQCVDYSKLVPLLIKSVQELKAENIALQARITTLENN